MLTWREERGRTSIYLSLLMTDGSSQRHQHIHEEFTFLFLRSLSSLRSVRQERTRERKNWKKQERERERQSNNWLIVIISFIIVVVVSSARLLSRIFHVNEPWMEEFDGETRVTYSAGVRRFRHVTQTITSQFSSRLFCHSDWASQSKCLSCWRRTKECSYFLRLSPNPWIFGDDVGNLCECGNLLSWLSHTDDELAILEQRLTSAGIKLRMCLELCPIRRLGTVSFVFRSIEFLLLTRRRERRLYVSHDHSLCSVDICMCVCQWTHTHDEQETESDGLAW